MVRKMLSASAVAILVASCVGTEDTEDSLFDGIGEEGAADMVSASEYLGELPVNGTKEATWESGIRAYSFTVQAKAGAVINVSVEATAGAGSPSLNEGDELDILTVVRGPMVDGQGPDLNVSDQDGSGAAQLAIPLSQDGTYLVGFGTWDNPGEGASFSVTLGCEGTEFQCRRPVTDQVCVEGTEYIRGGETIGLNGGTVTWDKCEVVILEEINVAEGAILNILPGVHINGNYVENRDYGSVHLIVDGQLQAVGTEEHPVVFEAFTDDNGWAGIILNGDSNTLDHVYIEKANVGLEINGSYNTISHLNINSGEVGLRFGVDSFDNTVDGIRISQVTNGIEFRGAQRSMNEDEEPTAVKINDSIIMGMGNGIGIFGELGERSIFHRSLISGFQTGLHLDRTRLEVYDGTISNNQVGVLITGDEAGVHPQVTCPSMPQYTPPDPPPPARPSSWYPDPIFVRCDIVNNSEAGIRVNAPELLVVENSNLRGNGAGVIIEADTLHEESRIRESNLFGNGDSGVQLDTFHQFGVINITDNYWAQVSDPMLSDSWQTHHSFSIPCQTTRTYRYVHDTCTRQTNTQYTCGSYDCTGSNNNWNNNWTCTALDATAAWDSPVNFEGFYPTELPSCMTSPNEVCAGPSLDEDDPEQKQVIEQREQLQL